MRQRRAHHRCSKPSGLCLRVCARVIYVTAAVQRVHSEMIHLSTIAKQMRSTVVVMCVYASADQCDAVRGDTEHYYGNYTYNHIRCVFVCVRA